MERLEFQSIEEELAFYKKIVNSVPALINVNQVEVLDDPGTSYPIWSNQAVSDFIGYTKEEMKEMGFTFFSESMHPDDMALIFDGYNRIKEGESPIFGGFLRIRPKDGDYLWFVGGMSVFEMKDGKPWRILAMVQNLEKMTDTRNQIIQLVKENMQLRNQIRIKSLSKREKQIVRLIARGRTDKEIARELSISPSTAKTHRHTIIQKLQLRNKAAIAQFATENGLD